MTTTETAMKTNPGTTKFKILAADKLAKQGLEFIQSQADAELVNKPGLSEDELAGIVGEHDAMIVRSGVTVTAKVLENHGRLKVIARAGVGVDNIDLEAATAKGILVVNTAEANTLTTAEHAFALMLALARNVGPAYKTMNDGGWDRSKFQGRQLAGKTLGIVGFGRIGRALAERALAFEMNVVAYDPFFNAETALDGRVKMFKSFTDMLPECDVASFHVPLNDQTRSMLGKETWKLAKPGLMVVNAARGGVIDEDDIIPAIEAGQCGGAALDVFTDEPPAADHPLRKHPKVLVTPHLGASTVEAQQAVSLDAAASVLMYLRGDGVKGAVNAAGLRLDLSPIQQRFADLAQRMTTLIGPMLTGGIGDVSFECSGQELGSAADALLRITLADLLNQNLSVPVNLVNVMLVAEQRGITAKSVKHEEGKFGPQLTIEVQGTNGESRRIVGRIYDDLKPRVIEINGYHMDMIPAGDMVIVQNQDKPGIIGMVGNEFGEATVNIADMSISRRQTKEGATALMVLKTDAEAPDSLIDRMRARPGILKVAKVKLPAEG
ncbi:MAG: phosphoglycerate dehydrogenase [Phycisphaeraceae bacterium]